MCVPLCISLARFLWLTGPVVISHLCPLPIFEGRWSQKTQYANARGKAEAIHILWLICHIKFYRIAHINPLTKLTLSYTSNQTVYVNTALWLFLGKLLSVSLPTLELSMFWGSVSYACWYKLFFLWSCHPGANTFSCLQWNVLCVHLHFLSVFSISLRAVHTV